MSFNWMDDDITDTFDPWFACKPDPTIRTGGDWYQLLLCASLGGKAAHGANTAPSCEVLCKASLANLEAENYGTITWDDRTKAPGILGSDISDQFYLHHPYRGTVTASGSLLAYESSLWEPSVRRRARSSALLAAGLAVHGLTKEDACAVVSKITCEPVDIQAVDSAIIPASHLKRELVLVSKANHRIFTRGTLQSGITWHDSQLTTKGLANTAAFDWGRVTAIARYIAEANIQNCANFRSLAKRSGIPYSIVRNAWAYVSDADYQLPVDIFDEVPIIDLAALKIPSLIGSFVGHEQEIMLALNRGSKTGLVVPENDAFQAYIQLHNDAKERARGRKRTRVPLASEAEEVYIEEHTLSASELDRLLEGGRMITDAYLTALASLRAVDHDLHKLLKEVVKCDLETKEGQALVDKATSKIYSRDIWLMTRVIAESKIKDADEEGEVVIDRSWILDKITSRIADLKMDIVGYHSHIETDVYLSLTQIASLRERTKANARRSAMIEERVTVSQRDLASQQVRRAAESLTNVVKAGDKYIKVLNREVSATFEAWYKEIAASEDEQEKHDLAYFAFHYYFLRNFNVELMFQKGSGYIEGMMPQRSYAYQAVLRTSTDYGFEAPKLQRPAYHHVTQIAEELDRSGKIPYSVLDAVERTTEMGDMVIGDLTYGRVWRPAADMLLDAQRPYRPVLSPPYDDSMLREAEQEYEMQALLDAWNKNRVSLFETGYNAVLNSYPSQDEADKLARAMGYPDLKAAHAVLGNGVFFDEMNQYILDARARLALNREDSDEEEAETSNKRKFDDIM